MAKHEATYEDLTARMPDSSLLWPSLADWARMRSEPRSAAEIRMQAQIGSSQPLYIRVPDFWKLQCGAV